MTRDERLSVKNTILQIILISLVISNVALLPMYQPVQAIQQLMEENDEDGGGEGLSIYTGYNLAQCFNTDDNYTLKRVSLHVKDEVGIDDFLEVEIYDNDDQGDGISDNDLPNSSISIMRTKNGPDNEFVWLDFQFSVTLTEGERYWIVASCGAPDGDGYRWKDSENDSYPDGHIAKEGNPVWVNDTSTDLMFRVFGEYENDVGVEDVIATKLQELYVEANITAVIMNYGADTASNFDVICAIEDPFGSEILNETKTIASLDSGDMTGLTWFFTPIIEGNYSITIATLLTGDENNKNNVSGMNMNVQAMAVLKLHEEINIVDPHGNWCGDEAPSNDTWHTSRREYIWNDTIGDDNGDGDYTYPNSSEFEPGCLDITEFRVAVDLDSINFRIEFVSIDVDFTEPYLGFSQQIIEILVDVDRDGTGREDTIRNARLKLDKSIGWEYAIWADGYGQGYLEDEFGNISRCVEAWGSPETNAVQISIPINDLGLPNFEIWRYVVLVGAWSPDCLPQDVGGSKHGFMRVDKVNSSISGGGGEDRSGADSNVYDMVFASPQNQQLNNYGSEDFLFANFTDTEGPFDGEIYMLSSWAQSFTAPFTCLLSSVDIYARDVGLDSTGMVIGIFENNDMDPENPSDDVPSTVMISSQENVDFSTEYEWQNVNFSNPAVIRGGEIYWIVAGSMDPEIENGYHWGMQQVNPWPGGHCAKGEAGLWDPYDDDMLFNAYFRILTTVDTHQPIYFAPLVINGIYVNGSAEHEWINISYHGTLNANELLMNNWTLTDQDGNIFQFEDFRLYNTDTVTVYSGFGINTTEDLYWNKTVGVWNDFGDDVLLNSSFIVPVDFMNYSNGNEHGDGPPTGMNWGPEEDEELPMNPKALQKLSLKMGNEDNDFYSDWELDALGWLENKTLYFYDDGTLDQQDPYDYMNTTPPTGNDPGNPDDDGYPGLTLRISGGPPTNPRRYQEFNLTPVLAKDLNIADDVVIDLWVDDEKGGSNETVMVALYDCNQTTKTKIANESKSFLTDETSGWELVTINILDVDYTLQEGHYLVLHIRADDPSSEENLWLAYNSSSEPSCIRTIPTRTFINVEWAKTYDINEGENSTFLLGEKVIIKANVSDPFGSYDIEGANISSTPPNSPEGTEIPMILRTTDPIAPSVWKLFNYTYSNTNKAGNYKVKITGIESNGVKHTITIYFNVKKNEKPKLTNCSLIPDTGFASTSFNFSVNYTDVENHSADVIVVNITGYGIFDMLPLDPLDLRYDDGKIYYINLTGFKNGTSYWYHFAANDSKGLWNDTSELPGPEVQNTAPTLSDRGLNPIIGNASTGFNFTVNYTDIDNQEPSSISVNNTGPSHEGSWEMKEVDKNDDNYADGKLYYYNYTGFYNGSYTHHFAARDSQGAWAITIDLSEPNVENTPPFLIGEEVSPEEGYITTEFNYTVTYLDLDNQAPTNITMNISGPWHSGGWEMKEVDPSDEYYVDGKDYYYTCTGLIIGSYSFYCWANDSEGAWYKTSDVFKPIVYNTRPTLSPPNLVPTVGEASVTGFNYTVTYTDLDNHAPGNITVNITGPFSDYFAMKELDPSDQDYTNGKVYYYNTTLPLDGEYSYRIDAKDNYSIGLWAIPPMDFGPNVGSDAPPVLSNPGVAPVEGITSTLFNFTVNFTDYQNDPAGVITLNLSGPSGGLFTMLEVDPSDTNTKDGKWFYYNLPDLRKGEYSFNVFGNDSLGNYAESANKSLPLVKNSLPQLSGGYINESQYGGSWFNFSLIYLDIDNDPAGNVYINISGMGNFSMDELDPSDVDRTDGKEYYYNTTLPKGNYSYRFEASDTGFGMKWNHTSTEDINLINNIPIFSQQDVTPPTGFGGDYFNFTVTMVDYDNDTLEVLLYIDGEPGSPYTMLELDTFDTNTIDGKVYYYNISLVRGSYDYNYSAYDGEKNNQTIPITLTVKNYPPEIVTSDVTSTDEDSLYSVDYDNIDSDGDEVTWCLETNATWLNIDSNTGVLEGTPTNLEVGNYYVNVTVDDNNGGIDFHNFTLVVINTLPLITKVPVEFAQEDIIHLDEFTCIDDDQGNIVYSLDTNASWLSIIPTSGIMSGKPENPDVGWYWVNVSVEDGNGGVDSINYTLFVNNTPPIIDTEPYQVTIEDTDHVQDFYCTDENQGNTAYSLSTNATWLYINNPSNGILSGTPRNPDVGWFWVNVSVNDGNGGMDYRNYTLTVINKPPTILGIRITTAQEDSLHEDNIECDDEGQGNVIYSLTTNATWLNFNPSTGRLNGTPNNNHVGSYYVNVSFFDGNGGMDYVNYTLTVLNTPPTINTTPIPVVTQDIPYYDDFNCVDDGQGNIVYTLLTNATWLYFNSTTGELNGTPNNTYLGWSWVNVSVTDGNGGMDYINYSLTVDDVNDPPQITTTNVEFAEEDPLYYVDYEYIDVDDPIVTWQLKTNSTWLSMDQDTGVLSGTPENDDIGWYWVNVTIIDGRGKFDYTNFTITVNNTPPVITNTPDEFVNEDEQLWNDFNCSDDGQGTIIYSLSTNASWLSFDTVTGLLSGKANTPNNLHVGWYWVNVTVEDGNGGTDFRNYTLTVNNTPPSITTIPNQIAVEDSPHANDFDCIDDDQGNIVYSLLTNATWLGFNSSEGTLFGFPYNNHVGWYWVNITVDDGNGGTDFRNYTLTVFNIPPSITSIPDDTAVEDLLHFDDFNSSDDGQGNIIYSLTSNATWLSIDQISGVVSETPNNLHVGVYFVNVSVSDGNGGVDFINYTLTVFNTPPNITTIPEENAIEEILHVDDFNCNDDGQGNITYYLITNASWLNIDSSTGVLSGTPDISHVDWYWVNVSVSDGNEGMDYINYTLTVADVNNPPVIITSDILFGLEDSIYWVDYEFTDLDDPTVIWQHISNASWLSMDSNTGVLSGTPENDDVGICWVNVTVNDGRGGFDYTNFTIMVNNTPPMITNTPIEFALEDALYRNDFNCSDDNQGNIIYSLFTNATWLNINPTSGMLSGISNNMQIGWYWVNVTVSDGNGGIDYRNFTINVNNSLPTITTIPEIYTYEDSVYIEDINCIDDGQGTITYNIQTNASWLSIDPVTGIMSGAPLNDDVGIYWVNISVEDGNDGTYSLNYSLTVINTNDPPIITTIHTEFVVQDSFYIVDYDFIDVDADSVVWGLDTNATWLSIDPITGVLSGIPRNAHVGSYYVKITADDNNGGLAIVNFTLTVGNINDPPSVPQLLWPVDDSTVNTTLPTFNWSASIDPDVGDYVVNYTLQYSMTSGFTDNVTTITNIIDSFYIPTIQLEDKAIYYWRVEAFESNGVGSGYQATYFVFTIDSGYTQPIYIGGIKSKAVKKGETWTIDLDDYFQIGSVTHYLRFTSNYEEIKIDPVTHVATWKPKDKNSQLTDVVFTMSDGVTNVSSFPIDLSVEKESASLTFWDRIFWPWSLIPMIFLILLAGVIGYKKRKERPIVEEVFFISENGNLISHTSVRSEEDVDEDILSGMLTGVKDLISDAFVREEEGKEEKGLHKLEFGEKNILLEKGNYFFIAIVFAGKENKVLLFKIKGVIEEIEERYRDVLGDWDGDLMAFEGSDEIIQALLSLEMLSEEERQKIKDDEIRSKILERWSQK